MPTPPYAKLRANIASAGNLSGALVGAAGASCQLSQDPAGLGSSFKYEILSYPEGFAVPAGWTADAVSGVYYYLGLTPPAFALPASPLWGKLPLLLTVNDGSPGTSGLPVTQFTDATTVIEVPGPSGVKDIAYRESNQWDPKWKWASSLKTNIRLLSLIAAGYHGQVRLATAAALPAYTRSGLIITANAVGAMATIDGVAPAVADRILLKNGAAGADNGIYYVTQLGDGSNPFRLKRSEDFDASEDVRSMCIGAICEGTTNGGKQWKLTTPNPISLSVTSLSFTVF
jgi:hypothetical protein